MEEAEETMRLREHLGRRRRRCVEWKQRHWNLKRNTGLMTQRLRRQRRRRRGIDKCPDDDGDTSSSGYWEGVGRKVAPSRLGWIIVLVVIVVCRCCRLGFRRICHHPPYPDRLSFSSSSSFVVSVVLVVVVFVITPPLLIVLSLSFLIVLLVSLASSTIKSWWYDERIISHFYSSFSLLGVPFFSVAVYW